MLLGLEPSSIGLTAQLCVSNLHKLNQLATTSKWQKRLGFEPRLQGFGDLPVAVTLSPYRIWCIAKDSNLISRSSPAPCSPHGYIHTYTDYTYLERVEGIEPSSCGWKPLIIATILHTQWQKSSYLKRIRKADDWFSKPSPEPSGFNFYNWCSGSDSNRQALVSKTRRFTNFLHLSLISQDVVHHLTTFTWNPLMAFHVFNVPRKLC